MLVISTSFCFLHSWESVLVYFMKWTCSVASLRCLQGEGLTCHSLCFFSVLRHWRDADWSITQDTAIGQEPAGWEEPSSQREPGVLEKLFLFKNNYIFIIMNLRLSTSCSINHADPAQCFFFFLAPSVHIQSQHVLSKDVCNTGRHRFVFTIINYKWCLGVRVYAGVFKCMFISDENKNEEFI